MTDTSTILEVMARAMLEAMERCRVDGQHRRVEFIVEGGTGRIAPAIRLAEDTTGWSEQIGEFHP